MPGDPVPHITLRKGFGFALAPRGNMRATNLPTMPVRQRMFVRDLPSEES